MADAVSVINGVSELGLGVVLLMGAVTSAVMAPETFYRALEDCV